MTDQELKEAMKHMAKIVGLDLSQDRLDKDLATFKRHLAAVDAVHEVELELEDEPIPAFRLEKG
ncbi:MAG: hypothetical protein ACE1ZI_00235 [Acidobacteriota bacterium]